MDIKLVPARLKRLYRSESSSPSPEGPMIIYLGNQTMGRGEYLDLSRALDIGSELTLTPRDPTSLSGRTNREKVINGALAHVCLTAGQLWDPHGPTW